MDYYNGQQNNRPRQQGGRPVNRQGGSSQRTDVRGQRTGAPARQANAARTQQSGNVRRQQRTVPVKQAKPVKASDMQRPKLGSFVELLNPQRFDFTMFLIVVILLAFGLVMLFSASYASAKEDYGDSFYYINRQLVFAVAGFAAMIFVSFIDYRLYCQKFIVFLAIVVSVSLMVLVFVMGKTVGGAQRWLEIAGNTFQPSEILKLATIIVIADYMQRNYDKRDDFKEYFLPLAARIVIACGLVLIQPHLSCTVIIFITSYCMLAIGGSNFKHLALIAVAVAVGLFAIIKIFPMLGFDYVTDRLLSWQDPEADIQNATYQTYQSLVTIGSGGMFGLGLGNSRQKYGYLPVTQNDFIFSVICEELGFIGAMLVILLFIVFLFRGFYIASAAPDKFGMLLCSGIVIHLTVQAFLNIAVVTNAMPNTGVSLPFISYGGTALLMQMAEMGIVLNISRKAAMD